MRRARHVVARALAISRPVLWINTLGPALLGLWLTGALVRLELWPLFLWLKIGRAHV